MDENALLKRITFDPEKLGGKALVRGRRLAVSHVLGMLAAGETPESLLRFYPWLEPEDIQAVLLFAKKVVDNGSFGTMPEAVSSETA